MLLAGVSAFAQHYDIVLTGGRVMDPASGLNAVRNVGIRGGKIAAVSAAALQGKLVVNVKGLVVAPGFIDLHSHGQTPEAYAYKARDGVTTALEMEAGVSPVAPWYAARDGKALVNFGATSGHIGARMAVMGDKQGLLPGRDAAAGGVATADQRGAIYKRVRQGLDEGALGIGLGIAYVPKTTREEILDLFALAAERKVAVYVHMRQSGPVEPGVIDSLQEVIADAAATGASLHIVHITSMGMRQTDTCMRMIEGARKSGLDVTTEAYPYTAGMTDLGSAVFDDGWQERMAISYGDLQWAQTGERLTAETFAKYRKQGGMVAIHSIPEDVVRLALANPLVMIASDGIIENGKGHPRAAGTYARVLGRYVREQHVLTLMDALRRMTVMPADRLAMKSKGRIQVGADADITVFDAEKVIDKATFDNPAQYSEGIPFVLVNGTFAVKDGAVAPGVLPGKAIRR
jgi:N-acyl-D-aspartate/D-glutamate deacylase